MDNGWTNGRAHSLVEMRHFKKEKLLYVLTYRFTSLNKTSWHIFGGGMLARESELAWEKAVASEEIEGKKRLTVERNFLK